MIFWSFLILFTDKMFENITQHTNKRITNTLEKTEDLLKQSDK